MAVKKEKNGMPRFQLTGRRLQKPKKFKSFFFTQTSRFSINNKWVQYVSFVPKCSTPTALMFLLPASRILPSPPQKKSTFPISLPLPKKQSFYTFVLTISTKKYDIFIPVMYTTTKRNPFSQGYKLPSHPLQQQSFHYNFYY